MVKSLKTSLQCALIGAALISGVSTHAFARGDNVVGTPKGTYKNYEKGEISQFEQLMDRTKGYRTELPGRYTSFIPVNKGFEKLPQSEYPALYVQSPPKEAAVIVSNHFVPGEINLRDVVNKKGGLYATNGRFLPVMQGQTGDYYVDGHRVLASTMTSHGMQYIIDGVIINGTEMAALKSVPQENVVLVVPENTSIIQENRVTPAGNAVTTTTIVTPNQ